MKRTDDIRCCGTCRWAEFWLTDKGNFRKHESGRCTYPIDTIVRPAVPACRVISISNASGFAPTDHADCPLYEKYQTP